MCVSYSATRRLIQQVSQLNSAPWIEEGIIFKFWGDNVDKQVNVRDQRFDHKGELLHMFSILVAKSRTQALHLPHVGQLSKLSEVPEHFFLPTCDDVAKSSQVGRKKCSGTSESLDDLMKNETKRKDMMELKDYLGKEHDAALRVLSGGDLVTCERQIGAKRHVMCGQHCQRVT